MTSLVRKATAGLAIATLAVGASSEIAHSESYAKVQAPQNTLDYDGPSNISVNRPGDLKDSKITTRAEQVQNQIINIFNSVGKIESSGNDGFFNMWSELVNTVIATPLGIHADASCKNTSPGYPFSNIDLSLDSLPPMISATKCPGANYTEMNEEVSIADISFPLNRSGRLVAKWAGVKQKYVGSVRRMIFSPLSAKDSGVAKIEFARKESVNKSVKSIKIIANDVKDPKWYE